MSDPLAGLRAALADAAATLGDGAAARIAIGLERPPEPDFGDFSTNAAMLLAGTLGGQPREIAERLVEPIAEGLGDDLDRVEVAGPGFLNIFLSDRWYRRAAREALGARTGGPQLAEAPPDAVPILIEFVSANPAGPLTAAGGRHAAYGDAVARTLEATGHEVMREYYVNDAGGQIERFAMSIAAQMKGEPVPEDGYEGDYVAVLADRLAADGVRADDLDAIATKGAELMRASAEATLARYRVEFDTWYSESSLHAGGGATKQVLKDLEAAGHVYESEGAVWLRTTTFGDDKDRVLVRSGGEPTYYLADLAYHRDKLERSGGHLIDVLGADHHGYVERLKAGMEALGFDPERLEIAIMQLVHVVEGGERSQMSKRKGEFVTLDELIDDIGVDAARFFMLQRSHDTTVDLDLDLARRESSENPVYYVQYAHARISSILAKAGEGTVNAAMEADPPGDSALEPSERALVLRLLELPEVAGGAADKRAPHRLCAYSMTVAADFHAFYRDCKVVGADGDGVEAERIRLCLLAKATIGQSLELLGISAPEQM